MRRQGLILGLATAVLAASMSVADAAPAQTTLDRHIRIVRYVPDQVTRLDCTLGYVVTLYLGADERIENVATAWAGRSRRTGARASCSSSPTSGRRSPTCRW